MKKNKNHPHRSGTSPQKNCDEFLDAPGFSFVAGYTAWGFPYGTPVEENEEDPDSPEKEELPF